MNQTHEPSVVSTVAAADECQNRIYTISHIDLGILQNTGLYTLPVTGILY